MSSDGAHAAPRAHLENSALSRVCVRSTNAFFTYSLSTRNHSVRDRSLAIGTLTLQHRPGTQRSCTASAMPQAAHGAGRAQFWD